MARGLNASVVNDLYRPLVETSVQRSMSSVQLSHFKNARLVTQSLRRHSRYPTRHADISRSDLSQAWEESRDRVLGHLADAVWAFAK
jgi:hypothetical protein